MQGCLLEQHIYFLLFCAGFNPNETSLLLLLLLLRLKIPQSPVTARREIAERATQSWEEHWPVAFVPV